MRRIVLMGLLLSFNSYASMTFQHAKALFSHLQNKTGRHVILKLDKDKDINAYSTPYAIYIQQGMLDFVNKDSEMMLVLGHELTHFVYGDPKPPNIPQAFYELRADKQGYKWCKALGYNKCLDFMKRMHKLGHDYGNGVHPSWTYRIKHAKE